jgi:hypothetical protein
VNAHPEWKAQGENQFTLMSNMNYKKLIGGLGIAVVLASVTGCKSCDSRHDGRSEGRVTDDKNITETVKKELEEEPVYKFDDVAVNTFAGTVQLSGFVNTEDQKRRAQEVAEHTGGVTQVINGLAVKQFKPAPRIYAEPPTQSGPPRETTPPDQNPPK